MTASRLLIRVRTAETLHGSGEDSMGLEDIAFKSVWR